MNERVLIVDDEPNIIELVSLYLKNEGYEVLFAENGEEALDLFFANPPDILILDIMLPDIDGLEILRKIRKESQVPVIMLTAKESEVDKVVGLELGADDYLTKPFSPRELAARVRAVLRRSRAFEQNTCDVIETPGLRIDPMRRTVEIKGAKKGKKSVNLTATEFDLLYFFASNPGIVLTRERLLERVWGYDWACDTRTVDVYVRHLREKIGDDAQNPRFIETVRGVGYRFKWGENA